MPLRHDDVSSRPEEPERSVVEVVPMRVRDEHEVDTRPELASGAAVMDRTRGPTRWRRMGSVMIRTPSISMTTEEWPRNVTRALPGGVTRRSIVHCGDTGAALPSPTWSALETIRDAPKVLLHDHLDGGLRPATVIELARRRGLRGPAHRGRRGPRALVPLGRRPQVPGAVPRGLPPHRRRHADARRIERVAAECAEDLAADGIVYAEVRYAPELSTQGGLSLDAVMEAWLDGFERGARDAAAAGRPIVIRAIVTAMRQFARSVEIAELSVRYRDRGRRGLRYRRARGGLPAEPPPGRVPAHPSRELPRDHPRGRGLRPAVDLGGAPVVWRGAPRPRRAHRGRHHADRRWHDRAGSSRAVRARPRACPSRCVPTSNVHTGAVASIGDHPIDLLRRLRFRVTVNTDNRLMSGVTLSSELGVLIRDLRLRPRRAAVATTNAMKSSFLAFDERLRLINGVIKPGYARLKAEAHARGPDARLAEARRGHAARSSTAGSSGRSTHGPAGRALVGRPRFREGHRHPHRTRGRRSWQRCPPSASCVLPAVAPWTPS